MQHSTIITGITGQDGSYLADLLLAEGYKVYGFKRRTASNSLGCAAHLENKIEVVEGDLADLPSLMSLCKLAKADEFYNLAAQSHVGTSFTQPVYTMEATGLGVLNCLEAIRGSGLHTRFYQACHDKDTKILTPNGVKTVDEVFIGDKVFSFNEKTMSMEIKKIKRIYQNPYQGKMIKISGKRLSQVVTPNHQIVLRHDNGEIVRTRADELSKLFSYPRKSSLSLPYVDIQDDDTDTCVNLTNIVNLQELKEPNNFHKNLIEKIGSSDLLYLMGLYIGDGYKASSRFVRSLSRKERLEYRNKKTGEFTKVPSFNKTSIIRKQPSHTILFAIPTSDPARQELIRCLERNNLDYTAQGMTITVTSLPLSKVFSLCGDNVHDKTIPEFVYQYSQNSLRMLLKGIIDSDGHLRLTEKGVPRSSISTVSNKLVANLTFLVKQCGFRCNVNNLGIQESVITKEGIERTIKGTTDSYSINISYNPKNKLYPYMISEEQYDGNVWCLEVEDNHNFMVVRDNHVAISGNSTSELFGGQEGETVMNEQSTFHPRSPYGVAKLYGYWITVNYRESYKMFACNGLLFNHEGPRRGSNFVTRKITKAVAAIKAGTQEKLFLGNLDAKRDWGHAKDYVRGMHMIMQHNQPEDFVLATGETHSVREFCELAFKHAGLGDYRKYVEIDPQFYRPAEVDVLIGDPSKARQTLGWTREYGFVDLVKEMVDHDMAVIGRS